MKNPWMSAWLRATNTTLSAAQAFWTELMRQHTRGTKSDSPQGAEPEMHQKAENAPTPSAEKPAANGEPSPPGSKAGSEPASQPQTDSKEPATAPQEEAASKETAVSARTAQPETKTARKTTAAPNKAAAAEKTAAAEKAVAPKRKAEVSGATKAKTGASAPKFQHPTDPDLTWSGRGRRPRWVTEALDAGRTLDDLRVQKH